MYLSLSKSYDFNSSLVSTSHTENEILSPPSLNWCLILLPHGFSPVVTGDRAWAHLSYRQAVLTILSPSGTAKKKKPFFPGSLSSLMASELKFLLFLHKSSLSHLLRWSRTSGLFLAPYFLQHQHCQLFWVFSKIHLDISGWSAQKLSSKGL